MSTSKSNFWSSPLTKSRITSDDVKMPEMLLGYFIGPFGALLSSGIFTSILQNYFTDVLKLDLGFLTTLQLVSTVLIVASNLIVGQLIEHTKALAGKARPWILLSALTLSVASVLMFIVPFEGMAKMVWIAIAYNLYYAVAYPIYNTANSTMIPVSTRDSKQRGALASFTNVAGLGVMGCGSMVFPMLVSFALKENQHLWFLTMLAVAIFSALTIYLQFLFTRERVTEEGRADTETPAQSATLGEQLKAVTGDRMWWIVMAFYMLFQWSGAMKNGSMSYFCKWVLDKTGRDYFAVILDWKMPEMDGIATARKIRERVGEDVTIIILTSFDFSEIEEEARAAGVNAFMAKPLFRSRLTATLRQFTSGKKEKNARNYLEDFAKENYAGKRILLVEDNELNREIATEIIGMTGVTIDIAENGKIAVEKVMEAPEKWYDLIFMDIQMPIMNGYEATAAIRALAGSRGKVPIIAMTANAFAEDVQLAKNTGMNEHIAKPLDLNKLNDVLKQWL